MTQTKCTFLGRTIFIDSQDPRVVELFEARWSQMISDENDLERIQRESIQKVEDIMGKVWAEAYRGLKFLETEAPSTPESPSKQHPS